jgi:hypothetical protein
VDVTPGTCGREPLVEAIAAFVVQMQVRDQARLRPLLVRAIDGAGPHAIDDLTSRLSRAASTMSPSR